MTNIFSGSPWIQVGQVSLCASHAVHVHGHESGLVLFKTTRFDTHETHQPCIPLATCSITYFRTEVPE